MHCGPCLRKCSEPAEHRRNRPSRLFSRPARHTACPSGATFHGRHTWRGGLPVRPHPLRTRRGSHDFRRLQLLSARRRWRRLPTSRCTRPLAPTCNMSTALARGEGARHGITAPAPLHDAGAVRALPEVGRCSREPPVAGSTAHRALVRARQRQQTFEKCSRAKKCGLRSLSSPPQRDRAWTPRRPLIDPAPAPSWLPRSGAHRPEGDPTPSSNRPQLDPKSSATHARNAFALICPAGLCLPRWCSDSWFVGRNPAGRPLNLCAFCFPASLFPAPDPESTLVMSALKNADDGRENNSHPKLGEQLIATRRRKLPQRTR